MDLPSGPVQDCIRIAGIAAVYVARLPSGACRIGSSRDLQRTVTMLRRQDLDLTCVAAFWVDDIKVATKIASRVNKAFRRAGGVVTEADATTRIAAMAADMKVHLTDHAAVMQRVQSVVRHLTTRLESARQGGGLAWFNRAYHDWRVRAKACGYPPMSYGQARARLRRVTVRRALAGELTDIGASILPLVFPSCRGKTQDWHNPPGGLNGID